MGSTLTAAPGGLLLFDGIGTLSRSGAADLSLLREVALATAEDPGAFLSWLGRLREDSAAALETARRSYWHPNGFAKIVLHSSSEPEFRIRLHVWPAVSGGVRLGESNPHSHRWEFASTAIVGEGLHMVEYRETNEGGQPYRRYRYGMDPRNTAALRVDGTTRLIRTSSPHALVGQVYSCDTSVVHTVRPIGRALTATVVFQGPRRSSSTVVYREPTLGDDQPNGVLTESNLHELAASVIEAHNARESG